MRYAILFLPALPALLGCGNPSLDVKITALGGEAEGVSPGACHRPAQPCLDCHGPYKGASPEMSIAGTVYASPSLGEDGPTPVEGVNITIFDADGLKNGVPATTPKPPKKTTNCAGNFWFTTAELTPNFPLAVKIQCPDPADPTKVGAQLYMQGRIAREGSCGGCHQSKKDQGSPGLVYCSQVPGTVYPKPNCKQNECTGLGTAQ